jgi:hypothetical protein
MTLPKDKPKFKTGRPRLDIDWEMVDKLLMADCPGTDVAAYFGISHHTLYDNVAKKFGMPFTNYREQKKAKGDDLLRAKQFETAMKGNVVMQIWLGKQRLGQREPSPILTTQEVDKSKWEEFSKFMASMLPPTRIQPITTHTVPCTSTVTNAA